MTEIAGELVKMQTTLAADTGVNYHLSVGDNMIPMNPLLGRQVQLTHTGKIHCQGCGVLTKKSYSGGFCFPCSQKLAQCDLCFMQPERCHFHQGTCREPAWGEAVCMRDHLVYLANSSGLKVGITRVTQIPTRWMDQGATQALPIFSVKSRYQSGLVEQAFKRYISDRTDWRKMLRGEAEPIDLTQMRDALQLQCAEAIGTLQEQFGVDAIQFLPDEPVVALRYPVVSYPDKVTSLNLDKTPQITGVLQGIKGQYLLLDSGVLNIRKYTGYQVVFEG